MGMRHALASLLPAALLLASCADVPPPTASRPMRPGEAQGAAYQQQAGYARGSADQPVATATGASPPQWGIPGLIEVAPRTVPDAVAQLDRAEQLLGFVLSPRPGEEKLPSPPPAGSGSISVSPETPAPLGDPCLIACAALASMKRSADHVCTMAGDGDAMCGTARSRVQRAEQRVTAACPACSAGK